MRKKDKKMLRRIIASAIVFVLSAVIPYRYPSLALLLVSYATIGWDVLYRAVRNIVRGQVFDENFLMAIATIGAIATGEYHEAVFVMLFYQVGELFQSIAVGKSRKSITSLMDLNADTACVLRDGNEQTVDPAEVKVGETLVIRPGEKIALDGVITQGESEINTCSLTGESAPVYAAVGDSVMSGCINISGVIYVKVTHELSQSTVSKIMELVENSAANKSKSEAFITRFARYYTPAVVISALCLALIPPIFTGNFREWIYRAMTFLVISCPCALVISVPLTFFGGIGRASRDGILVKGGVHLEALAKCDTVIFDKTGTLTEGEFAITKIIPNGIDKAELLLNASAAESFSNHPIAAAITRACPPPRDVADFCELAGRGTRAVYGGKTVHAGNASLMEQIGVLAPVTDEVGTLIYVAIDGVYVGCIVLNDKIKPTAKRAVKQLGLNTVMLTGDKAEVAKKVADELGIAEFYSQLLPADKVKITEKLITDGKTVAFAGDGINDAPVLARAHVGIAMGGVGSDAAIEAADIVLMDDNPEKIPAAIKLSKKTCAIVRQNIAFVLTVKAVTLILGALGLAGMWAAVFADVGVAVIAILNAIRTMKH